MFPDKKILKFLPSVFTLGNLLCGFLAVINVIEGSLTHAAWWIIIAAIFDSSGKWYSDR